MIESLIVGMTRATVVALIGFATLISPTASLGDDARKGDEKPRASRIFVYAYELKKGVPRKEDQPKIGVLSVDPETGESKRVGDPEIEPGGSLSPDGRYIARNHGRPGTPEEGLWIHDLTGGGPPRKVFDRFGGAFWLNHGEQMLISHTVDAGKYKTYRIKADGSGLTQLPLLETVHVVGCSQDGLWIASVDRTDGHTRIHVMRADGTERHTVVDEKNLPNADVQLSPDGKKVAYVKISLEETRPRCSLWVVDRDGKNRDQVPIAFDLGLVLQVRWSPDGNRFALVLNINPGPGVTFEELAHDRLAVVGIDGQNMRTLPVRPSKLRLLGWR